MAVVLTHIVALYAIVAVPWLGRLLYQKARRRIRAGDPLAKVRLCREIVIEQVIGTVVVLWLCFSGAISPTHLGLGAPRSGWLTAASAVGIGTLLLWSGLRLRPKAQKIREKLKDRAEALLPDTLTEQRWFAAVSIGAGINEELIFRGFLFWYCTLWLPHLNSLGCALVTSLIFGMAHLY
jgi:membrane protease YdiL (CAAX protease family)